MIKALIWGASSEIQRRCIKSLNFNKIEVVGFIDKNTKKIGGGD